MRWHLLFLLLSLFASAIAVAIAPVERVPSKSTALDVRSKSDIELYNRADETSLEASLERRARPSPVVLGIAVSWSAASKILVAWLWTRGPESANWLKWLATAHVIFVDIFIMPMVILYGAWDAIDGGRSRRIHQQMEDEELGKLQDESYIRDATFVEARIQHIEDMKIKDETLKEMQLKIKVLEKSTQFLPTMRVKLEQFKRYFKLLDGAEAKYKEMVEIANWLEMFKCELEYDTKRKLDRFDQLYEEGTEMLQQALKERKDLREKIGPAEVDKAILDSVLNDDKKSQRRSRRGGPRMIREKSESCESEFCHRLWYTRSTPSDSIQKRDDSPLGAIHEFHITPHDFDFHEPSSFNRRQAPDVTSSTPDMECNERQKIGTHNVYWHAASTGKDDESSQLAFSLLGGKEMSKLLAGDVEELGYDDFNGHKITRILRPGLGCMKWDLSDKKESPKKDNLGPPAAITGFFLGDEPDNRSGEDLITECEIRFGLR